eukprot:3180102-Amphidinium_carterae.1
MIGIANPDDLCSHSLRVLYGSVHQRIPPHRRHSSWTRPQNNAWGDAISPRIATDAMLGEAFLSHNWTTIQIVRDPWYRAIRAYQAAMGRRQWDENVTADKDVLQFTLLRAGTEHHTGAQAHTCGNQYVTYDYVVQLEHLRIGLDTIVQHVILPRDAIHTGWENCTGGLPDITSGPVSVGGKAHASTIGHQD